MLLNVSKCLKVKFVLGPVDYASICLPSQYDAVLCPEGFPAVIFFELFRRDKEELVVRCEVVNYNDRHDFRRTETEITCTKARLQNFVVEFNLLMNLTFFLNLISFRLGRGGQRLCHWQ